MGFKNLANKTILLFTEVIYGSGDFFAAKKLIRQLQQEAPNTRIYWYVSSPKARQDVQTKLDVAKQEFGDTIEIHGLDSRAKIDLSHCQHCDLVLLFPTAHELQYHDLRELQRYKAPILQVYEYDGMPQLHRLAFKSELLCVSSGFNGLGLHLEDLQQRQFPKPPFYDPSRVTFFSYLNLDTSQVINQASLHNYLHIALDVADAEKSVDLIANSTFTAVDNDFLSSIWSHGFGEIIVLVKDKDGSFQEHRRTSPRHDAGTKQLRLIQAFPLSNEEMLGAMAIAHPLMQVTGDQSLSEVMSQASINKGAFPFYQLLSWKNELHQHWLEYARACLGEKSHYVTLLQQLAKDASLDTQAFAASWRDHEAEILADSLTLHALLKTEKNLTRNYLAFLDHVFYIAEHFPDTDFHSHCLLAVQLISKLGDSNTVQHFLHTISTIENPIQRNKHLLALTQFLTMNPASVTAAELCEVSTKLLTLTDQEQPLAVCALKQILAQLPAQTRDRKMVPLLTDLLRVSSGIYPIVLQDICDIKHNQAQLSNEDWFTCIVDKHMLWDKPRFTKRQANNSILLAVNVFSDGVGDLAKFIGIFHLLRGLLPTTKINCLIHCNHLSRQTVLAMLRENKLPLLDTTLCSFSDAEELLIQHGQLAREIYDKKYLEIGFYNDRNQALIISVATPFPPINLKFRAYTCVDVPYLDIAEVEFASYPPEQCKPYDVNHHLVTMGLDNASVGMEITPVQDRQVGEIIDALTPALALKLLDGDNREQFAQNTLFMPAYVKNDRGILSLYYLLTLARIAYAEKPTALLWLHALPCDINSPALHSKMRDAGFSHLILYEGEQRRKEIAIENPINNRQLRLITGRIASSDFDLLFQLASKMGGFAGCTGQNSFEKAVSFSLIPAFSAPAWQMPILSQTRSLVTSLFPHQSTHYQVLNDYISMLIRLSELLRMRDQLQQLPVLTPYMSQFKDLNHIQLLDEVQKLYPRMHSQLHEYLPITCEADPIELLEQYFSEHSINDLKSAWQALCDHIKAHKNLNTWITNKIHELIPDPTQLLTVSDSSTYKKTASVLACNARQHISPQTLPQTAEWIDQLLNGIASEQKRMPWRFMVSNSNELLIDNVCGLLEPTIAISTRAWFTLTQAEMRFGLRMCLGIADIYPVENAQLRTRSLSQEEILKQIKGDLAAGISFCRKTIETLRAARSHIAKTGKTQYYYELGYQEEFYQDFIKLIEMHLAIEHKNTLQMSLFKPKVQVVPEKVKAEIKCLDEQWKTDDRLVTDNRSSAEQLHALLDILPDLRVRNLGEYNFPTMASLRFLSHLEAIQINTNKSEDIRALKAIVSAAHQHCVAIFTKIYLCACNKLSATEGVIPMGPFETLQGLLNDFVTAKTAVIADEHAKKIEAYLLDPLYKGLFYHSKQNEEHAMANYQHNKEPDYMLCSSIGAQIQWLQYIKTPNLTRLHSLAIQSGSSDIAKVLFRLGCLDHCGLWDLLPDEFIYNMTFIRGIVLGDIPPEFAYGCSSEDFQPMINMQFRMQYLQYRHDKPVVPCQSPLSISHLESFIQSNKDLLALTSVNPRASQELTALFERFIVKDPLVAKAFLKRFYCDKSYEHGIYTLREHRKIAYDYDTKYKAESPRSNAYLAFLINHSPEYIPLTALLDSLEDNFSMVYSNWPVEFFFNALKLRIHVLEDVVVAVNKIASLSPFIRSLSGGMYLTTAVSNTLVYAAGEVADIQVFSPIFSTFMAAAKTHGGTREVCDLLWRRKDFISQIMNPKTPIEISPSEMATLYQTFDAQISWPESTVRDRFSILLLDAIKGCTDVKERETSTRALLFVTLPMSDMLLIKELIKIWVAIQADKHGIDDNTYSYFKKLSFLSLFIHRDCPSLYVKDVLEELSQAIESQEKVSDFIDQQLNPPAQTSLRINTEDLLVNIADKLSKENVALDFVQFLSYELSRNSLTRLVGRLGTKAREALAKKHFSYQRVDDKQAEVLAIFFYHSFWARSIDERAVIINNLLIPSNKVTTEQDANQAYREALKYIIDQLFPAKNPESNLCIALLESYLETSNTHVRPYLLSAVLTANRMVVGQQRNMASTLPKLAEALGAAGVKAGQAGHSFPGTPQDLREGLAYLKSQARIPYRWELWKLVKAAIPNTLRLNIDRMKLLLGGASFYLAVEVVMKNGDIRVLRLLRDNAKNEAKHGFEHLKATLSNCQDEAIHSIADDLESIILEAEKGAQIEINHDCAKRQYEIATSLYNQPSQTVIIDKAQYHVQISPVTLYEVGEGYQLISKACGIEFNDLKKQPQQQALCQAVAMAVYKTELKNMLSGQSCDFDRHGAQARITCHQVGPDAFEVHVVNYDFGEISPEPPTQQQLAHCQNFIGQLAKTLFSSTNLLKALLGSQDQSLLTQQLTKQMIDYIRTHDNKDKDSTDLARLRGLFKGLLALNDYFEAIPKNKAFLLELSTLFNQYAPAAAPSLISRLFGLFSGGHDRPDGEGKLNISSARH